MNTYVVRVMEEYDRGAQWFKVRVDASSEEEAIEIVKTKVKTSAEILGVSIEIHPEE